MALISATDAVPVQLILKNISLQPMLYSARSAFPNPRDVAAKPVTFLSKVCQKSSAKVIQLLLVVKFWKAGWY